MAASRIQAIHINVVNRLQELIGTETKVVDCGKLAEDLHIWDYDDLRKLLGDLADAGHITLSKPAGQHMTIGVVSVPTLSEPPKSIRRKTFPCGHETTVRNSKRLPTGVVICLTCARSRFDKKPEPVKPSTVVSEAPKPVKVPAPPKVATQASTVAKQPVKPHPLPVAIKSVVELLAPAEKPLPVEPVVKQPTSDFLTVKVSEFERSMLQVECLKGDHATLSEFVRVLLLEAIDQRARDADASKPLLRRHIHRAWRQHGAGEHFSTFVERMIDLGIQSLPERKSDDQS